MLYGVENKASEVLATLKKTHGLTGIKSEFEAEGSSFNDVVRLREICSNNNVKLVLKISGAEAKRDVIDSIMLGVDGIIAPMIETPFAVHKFTKLIEHVYPDETTRPEIAINIESKTSIANFDAILEDAYGVVKRITFGRTDLSASYFDQKITPDSQFILDLIQEKAITAKKSGFESTMGGSISARTIPIIQEKKGFCDAVTKIETRKCILPSKQMIKGHALARCLELEKLYLLSLREKNDVVNQSNMSRLVTLEQRC